MTKPKTSKVKSIEQIHYTGDTYNLHVEGNHNYFANDISVSNCHKGSADSIQSILNATVNSSFRIGTTGSLSDSLIDNLLIEGAIGSVEKIITMKELISLNLATKIVIKPIFLNYNKDMIKTVKKGTYQEEDKLIRNYLPRAKFIAKLANSFKDKNSILIYKNTDVGELILKEIHNLRNPDKKFVKASFKKPNDEKVYWMYSGTKGSDRELIRDQIEKEKGALVVGVEKIMSTGINLPSLNNLILENIGKSLTLTMQTLGRVGRLAEGKEEAVVYDIVDDLTYTTRTGTEYPNYKLKHFMSRYETYIKEGHYVEDPIYIKLDDDNDSII